MSCFFFKKIRGLVLFLDTFRFLNSPFLAIFYTVVIILHSVDIFIEVVSV